jgi:DNA-binding NarL/FixJ family response regulator
VEAALDGRAEHGALHRVMLVEDNELMRFGFRALLHAERDMVVVAEAAGVDEAVDAAVRTQPDLVVMDMRLRDGTGVQATLGIRQRVPDARVLMLSAFPDEQGLVAAILAGASGFVLKHMRTEDLLEAIRGVAAGFSLFDSSMSAAVVEGLRKGTAPRDAKLASLSETETRVLELVAKGWTNLQIAAELHYAERTVKKHISRVLEKLGAANRSEAAAYYAEHK